MLSHVQLCDPMGYSPPGSSIYGILQARILVWVAISSSKGSSRPRDWTRASCVSCISRRVLYHWTTWEANDVAPPFSLETLLLETWAARNEAQVPRDCYARRKPRHMEEALQSRPHSVWHHRPHARLVMKESSKDSCPQPLSCPHWGPRYHAADTSHLCSVLSNTLTLRIHEHNKTLPLCP